MTKTFITDPKQIPPLMMDGLTRYIEDGVPVGDFLRAVITNNLKDAVGRADDVNINLLPAYVIYLYNEAPALCWGDAAKYEAWIEHKESLRRKEAADANTTAGD